MLNSIGAMFTIEISGHLDSVEWNGGLEWWNGLERWNEMDVGYF